MAVGYEDVLNVRRIQAKLRHAGQEYRVHLPISVARIEQDNPIRCGYRVNDCPRSADGVKIDKDPHGFKQVIIRRIEIFRDSFSLSRTYKFQHLGPLIPGALPCDLQIR